MKPDSARAQSIASDWRRRQTEAIAQGALTNSKRPETFVKGVYPTHVIGGQGAYLEDVTGKRYLDFICGLGTCLFGYGHGEITQAIVNQAARGTSFSFATPLEVMTAEKLKEFFPWSHRVRFLKSGSAACSAAIKIARAATGRSQVISEGYHGWHDDFVSLTPPALGVPERSSIQKLGDIDSISVNTAAVIVEPVMTDNGPARLAWLRALRERCSRVGAVLIFDEIITGFRYLRHSVGEYHGITPDLVCVGKAIANGMPLAAVLGRQEIMEGTEYFVSTTYAGETLSLASALKAMVLLQTKYKVDELWDAAEKFQVRVNQALEPIGLKLEGYPTRGRFEGPETTKALLWQEACRAGILFGPSWFVGFQHLSHLDGVTSVVADIVTKIKCGMVGLEGELPSSPFAERIRKAG